MCLSPAKLQQKPAGHGSRFIESYNHLGWKGPLRSSSPAVNLTLPRPPLNHVPKHHIYTSFKYLSGRFLNHFRGQSVPMLDPFNEEIFPNIQSKPSLVQLETVSSHIVTCCLGEEINTHLTVLLATLTLFLPSVQLVFSTATTAHYWLMFHLLSTRALKSSFTKLLFNQLMPSLDKRRMSSQTRARILHSPVLNLMRFLLNSFSSPSVSFWITACPPVKEPTQWVMICKSAKVRLCPSS